MKTLTTVAIFSAGLSFFALADPARKVLLSTSAAEMSVDKTYSLVEIIGEKPTYPKEYDEGNYEAEMFDAVDKSVIKDASSQIYSDTIKKLVVKETATGKEVYEIDTPSLKSDDSPITDEVSKDFNGFSLSANGQLVLYFHNSNGAIYNKDLNSLVELPIHLLIDKKRNRLACGSGLRVICSTPIFTMKKIATLSMIESPGKSIG